MKIEKKTFYYFINDFYQQKLTTKKKPNFTTDHNLFDFIAMMTIMTKNK